MSSMRFDACGSSPLTRGARHQSDRPHRSRRLIPAHAGSTNTKQSHQNSTPAHPRSRGEHGMYGFERFGWTGSSPLTRGARVADTPAHLDIGLIPAHAGSTRDLYRNDRSERAHPRSRGEHGSSMRDELRQGGSSPLTRGARDHVQHALRCVRLIPAHAGSTEDVEVNHGSSEAHPRSRGEHKIPTPLVGSSPNPGPSQNIRSSNAPTILGITTSRSAISTACGHFKFHSCIDEYESRTHQAEPQ